MRCDSQSADEYRLGMYVESYSAYSIARRSSSIATLLAASAELAQSKIAVEVNRPALGQL